MDWKLFKQAMESTAKLTAFVVFILVGARVFASPSTAWTAQVGRASAVGLPGARWDS